MKIVLMHYHLKPGGVTTVIRHQASALKDECEVIALNGHKFNGDFPCAVEHIQGLSYDTAASPGHSAEEIAGAILKKIYSKWKDGCDLLHIHNPLIAKNKNLLKILNILKEKGIKFFLQTHDFAEDGRPMVYFKGPYPENCHYGVINSRDYNIMLKSGLSPKGLHYIPNTITPFSTNKKVVSRNIALYPVRAIRRKNIGEAILLSLFLKKGMRLGITLPPKNEGLDINSYRYWKSLVKGKGLPVEFELGLKYDFTELILGAKFIISTSITEGFGFSFLDPWTTGKYLVGRKLPEICSDFEKNSIKLDNLYNNFWIPIDWIDIKKFYKKWKTCLKRNAAFFNYLLNENEVENAFNEIISDNMIDFAYLDEYYQGSIIETLIENQTYRNRLIDINPSINISKKIPGIDKIILHNKKNILKNYNKENYKKLLLGIYKKVINTDVKQKVNKKVLFSKFFDLANFKLLKWLDYNT